MAEPPLAGADQETVTCPLPATPDRPVGAEGTVAPLVGVTDALAVEEFEGPTAFVATTVNVYP